MDTRIHTHCSPRSALSRPPSRALGSFAEEPGRAYDGLDAHIDFAPFEIAWGAELAYWLAYYAPLVSNLMMCGGDEGAP